MIGDLWRWLQGQMVQDVPDSLAACEFDCRALSCRRGDWERCMHRLRGAGLAARHRQAGQARRGGPPRGRAAGRRV
jgi:hypothetical protein